MVKSLGQLERERNILLRKANAKRSLQNLARQRAIKRRRIKAEINVLKNPKSIAARKTALKIGEKSVKVAFKGALLLGKHILAVAAEQNAKPVKRRKRRVVKRRKRKR